MKRRDGKRAALLELCAILAPKDKKAAAEVALAVDDPAAYLKRKRARMEERSIDEPSDLPLAVALIEALGRKRVGEIDWKWPFPEILHAIRPQLTRHKVKAPDFDWTLDTRWDQVETTGCLEAAGAFLHGRGLVLASIDFPADAYALIVVDAKTFAAARKAGRAAGVKLDEWRGKPPVIESAPGKGKAAGAPRRLKIDKHKVKFAGYLAGSGGDWLVFSEEDKTLWIDTSSWPPRTVLVPDGCSSIARRPDGAWLSTPEKFEVAPLRIHPRAATPPAEELQAEPPVRRFDKPSWLGKRALAFSTAAYLQDGKVMRPAPGLKAREQWGRTHGFVPQGAGGVTLWLGDGWELAGGAFERTWPLGLDNVGEEIVPDGDGFYFLKHGCIFEARRGKPLVRHLPKRSGTPLMPGPDGGVLLSNAVGADGILGSLYFPATREEIQLHRKLLGTAECKWLAWSMGSNRLYIGFHSKELWSIRGEDVLALPRVNA